jgi:hypothetical protein
VSCSTSHLASCFMHWSTVVFFPNICFRVALPWGANGLRSGCDHHGCLDQHALSCAKARFAQCVQQQVAKVVLADDSHDPCFPGVRKTFQQPRSYPIRVIFLANRNPWWTFLACSRTDFFEFRFVENGVSQTKTGGPFWNPHFVEFENILVLVVQNGGFVLVPTLSLSYCDKIFLTLEVIFIVKNR